jgi:hypothetical protein
MKPVPLTKKQKEHNTFMKEFVNFCRKHYSYNFYRQILKERQYSKNLWQCVRCKSIQEKQSIKVDHIEPIIPIGKEAKYMSLDEIKYNMFEKEVQILCDICHIEKTQYENEQRQEYKEKQKNGGETLL